MLFIFMNTINKSTLDKDWYEIHATYFQSSGNIGGWGGGQCMHGVPRILADYARNITIRPQVSYVPSYGSLLWISAETDPAGILLMRAPDYYIRSDSPASPLSASQFSDQSVQGV